MIEKSRISGSGARNAPLLLDNCDGANYNEQYNADVAERKRTKMKKGLLLMMALLLVLFTLSGCNLIGYDEALDGEQVVATVNGHEITKEQWSAYRDYLAAYEQQYMQQYFGYSMTITDDMLTAYGESALEQMIQSFAVEDKIVELGLDQLDEEEMAEIEEYATSMADFYKLMLRYQNYPELETVEEEAERLAQAETEEGAEPAEAVATVTNEELDAMLNADLEASGYTYEYFKQNKISEKEYDRIYDHVVADVDVSDEEVKAEFDRQVETQKTSFDATPSLYTTYQNYGYDTYYVPAGYRSVKHVLVQIDEEKQTEMTTLSTAVTTAESTITSVSSQLDELKAEDTTALDEEALAAFDEQVTALEEQLAQAQADKTDAQTKLDALTEEAFAEILPTAQEVLAKAQAGEDFDALVETYGEDPGMTSEPTKTTGYMVCEGLSTYEQAFQDAAMALENVGDVSAELVKTSYGYHVLQYTSDIAEGAVEYTDEIKTALYEDLLADAQDTAYDAAVTQWVSEATVKTFPKIMK